MVSLRLDDDLAAKIDKFADREGVSRSSAIRLLLGAALGEPASVSATREAVFELPGLRKRFLAQLVIQVQEAIPGALATVDGSA